MVGFLIDLDGTMYAGKAKVPHSDEFIKLLKDKKIPYLFVTNNSSRTPEMVAEHLQQLGIEAEAADVFTSAQAASQYIVELKTGHRVALVGEIGLEQALLQAGLEMTDQQPEFVVQGIDKQFTYQKLITTMRYIRGGATYILTNPDHVTPLDDGEIPGAGAIAAAIQTASQVQPIIIGKPSPIIMNYAVQKLGLPPEIIWVIGDNLVTDIGAGQAVGCKTALVLTGLTTAETIGKQIEQTGIHPDRICDHLMKLAAELEITETASLEK
ncbi:MAG: TIGR01457 family HAD-type hydrolase [Desulfitobacteriaceae bacterium]